LEEGERLVPILALGDRLYFMLETGAPIVRENLSSTGGNLIFESVGFEKFAIIKLWALLASLENSPSLERGSVPAPNIYDSILEFSGLTNLRVGDVSVYYLPSFLALISL